MLHNFSHELAMTIPSFPQPRLPQSLVVSLFWLGFSSVPPAQAQPTNLFIETPLTIQLLEPFNPDQERARAERIGQAPMDPAALYELLEVAVAQQNWTAALSIVETLQILQPERAMELQQYRQRLQALAGSPTPAPFTLSQPTPAGRTGDPGDLASRILIQNAKGRVIDTRAMRQGDLEMTYPESYQIDITFQSPQGYGPQQIPVRIRVNGYRGVTFYREVLLGTPRSGEIQVQFSVREEPRPQSVTVEVVRGPQQTFSLSLPASNKVLTRRFAN